MKTLQFNGSSNYVSLGTLGSLGSSMLNNGFFFKVRLKTTSGIKSMFGTLNTGAVTGVQVIFNADQDEVESSGKLCLFVRSNNGEKIEGATTVATNFNDGAFHDLEFFCNTVTRTIAIKVDGDSKAISYSGQTTPSAYSNFGYAFYVGCKNNRGSATQFLSCEIDSFSIGLTSSNLYGVYSINEGSGTSIADTSGHSNTGTLSGSPLPSWIDYGALLLRVAGSFIFPSVQSRISGSFGGVLTRTRVGGSFV